MTRRFLVLTGMVLTATAAAAQVVNPLAPAGPVARVQTKHLSVTAALDDRTLAIGDRSAIVVDVIPERGIHVYAPGKHTYKVVALEIEPQPWLRAEPTRYPPSEIYYFAPLDERIPVYQGPFRLEHSFTVLDTPAARKALDGQQSAIIAARLQYQACDDKVCFAPQTVPVRLEVPLTR